MRVTYNKNKETNIANSMNINNNIGYIHIAAGPETIPRASFSVGMHIAHA